VDRFGVVMNRQLPTSGATRRLLPVGGAGKAARFLAPAVFLLVVTAAVLLVRSTLRSDRPAAGTTPGVVTTRAASAPILAVSPPSPPKQYYVIASGDTLGAIASRFATTVDALLQLNPGIEPTALRPGEQIRVK
jgi:Tfp pilus assembly protein FimV